MNEINPLKCCDYQKLYEDTLQVLFAIVQQQGGSVQINRDLYDSFDPNTCKFLFLPFSADPTIVGRVVSIQEISNEC